MLPLNQEKFNIENHPTPYHYKYGFIGEDYLLSLEKESSKETSNRQRKTKRQKPTQREIRQK